METLLHWDTDFFLFLNGWHTDWADVFFWIVSQIWTWLPLYIFILWMLVKKFGKHSWISILLFFLIIFCTDQTCNILKNNVKRHRPSHTEAIADDIQLVRKPNGHYYYGGQYGFPSAHAANSMALAIAVFLFFGKEKKKRWILPAMIAWSLLLAYSRIYLGVHFPLDILVGFLVGGCWAWLLSRLYHHFQKKISEKSSAY